MNQDSERTDRIFCTNEENVPVNEETNLDTTAPYDNKRLQLFSLIFTCTKLNNRGIGDQGRPPWQTETEYESQGVEHCVGYERKRINSVVTLFNQKKWEGRLNKLG